MILTWVRRAEPGSDAEGELVEGGADPVSWRLFGNDLVAFAAQVLNQRGTCRDDPSRPQSLDVRASVAAWLRAVRDRLTAPLRPTRGLKKIRSARTIAAGHAFVRTYDADT